MLPRPLSLRTRLGFFGGFSFWFGIVFSVIGLLFAFIYLGAAHASRQFRDNDPRVSGVVTAAHTPDNHRGTSTSRFTTYHYRYVVDGRTFEAEQSSSDHVPTDQVIVQYVPSDPELSRIEGIDTAGSSWLLTFVVGFGVPGLLILYFGAGKGLRDIRRIRYGIVTMAKVVRKELPGAGFTRELQFTTADGHLYQVAPGKHTGVLQEGESMPVFYEAGHPADAVMLDKVEPRIRAYLN